MLGGCSIGTLKGIGSMIPTGTQLCRVASVVVVAIFFTMTLNHDDHKMVMTKLSKLIVKSVHEPILGQGLKSIQ